MEAWKGKMVTNEEAKILVTSVLVSGIAGKERTGKDLRAGGEVWLGRRRGPAGTTIRRHGSRC